MSARVAHPKRPVPWTRAKKLTLRQTSMERSGMPIFSDGTRMFSMAMVTRNVKLGSMQIKRETKTKAGRTLTVLVRRV